MARKSRYQVSESGNGVFQYFNNGVLAQTVLYPARLDEFQITESTSHQWPVRKTNVKRRKQLDSGGNFLTQKCKVTGLKTVHIDTGGSQRFVYNGPLAAYVNNYHPTSADFASVPVPSNSTLDGLGTKAIANSLPTNPLSGMGQFLGELREGLAGMLPDHKIWKDKAHSFQSLARRGVGEHLKAQFGWVPFLKDIITFADVAKNADKHIKQYERNSGRHVRRRFTFPDVVTTVVTNLGTSYGSPSLPSQMYDTPGTLIRTTKTTTKRWFSGAFTYYLPKVETYGDVAKYGEALASKLYGLRVTPSLLWKLTPWSWASDWTNSIGDVIHNWSAFANDGLVMHYGYIMEHQHRETTYALVGLTLRGGEKPALTQTFVTETKVRRKATPYGFGLNPSSFSAKQWSIIGALGISRAPKSLIF